MEDLNQLKSCSNKKENVPVNGWQSNLGSMLQLYQKWCTNTSQPDLQTLKRISELLNVSVSEIINFD